MQAFARLSTDATDHKYIAPTSALYQRYALLISQVPEEVLQIAPDYGYVLFLGESGRVWVTGRNDHGQLGLGDTISRDVLTQIMQIDPIRQVAVGAYHTLLLTESGVVLAAGDNRFKQLGVNARRQQLRYTAVSFNEPIKLIGADANHSVVVTESGQLWVCGRNDYGQIGVGNPSSDAHSFKHINLPAEVTQLKTTRISTAVVTRGGQLWFSGAYDLMSIMIPSVASFTQLELTVAVATLDVEVNGLTEQIMYVTADGRRFAL